MRHEKHFYLLPPRRRGHDTQRALAASRLNSYYTTHQHTPYHNSAALSIYRVWAVWRGEARGIAYRTTTTTTRAAHTIVDVSYIASPPPPRHIMTKWPLWNCVCVWHDDDDALMLMCVCVCFVSPPVCVDVQNQLRGGCVCVGEYVCVVLSAYVWMYA